MSLASDYRDQRAWRDWPTILDALPALTGQAVLDLGCGVGDLAVELVARGARVIGIDLNDELLEEARSRRLPGAEFLSADLRKLPELGLMADGIWSSFAAAYFTDLSATLREWSRALKPGGWIALTEIDDLFGHEPLAAETKALLAAYAGDALAAGRYDFHMGRKLRGHLEQAGFAVSQELSPADQELAFAGPARADVLDGWRKRFERMTGLRTFCGERIGGVQQEFLDCLKREDHRSTARVYCCIGMTC